MPTSNRMRYRLWYMSKPVIVLEWDKTGQVTKIVGGEGKLKIIRGGRFLDSILSQDIDDLHAEPIG